MISASLTVGTEWYISIWRCLSSGEGFITSENSPSLRSSCDNSACPPQREKASERLSGFYERWSVKFTAQYYEAKAREKAAKACSDRI